jgi:hypothetical protein
MAGEPDELDTPTITVSPLPNEIRARQHVGHVFEAKGPPPRTP